MISVSQQCSNDLKSWLDQAKVGYDVLQAATLDSHAKEHFKHQEYWLLKVAEADGTLES